VWRCVQRGGEELYPWEDLWQEGGFFPSGAEEVEGGDAQLRGCFFFFSNNPEQKKKRTE
jgi:hypothetical protein